MRRRSPPPRLEARDVLERVRAGTLSIDDALGHLRHPPVEDLGFARVDHHRRLRQGFPEVVFGLGKTPEQVVSIVTRLAMHNPNVLATKVAPEVAKLARRRLPGARYDALGRVLYLWRDRTTRGRGPIGVITAGTSDIPVAREATLTARLMGNAVDEITDVGVAGIHRLLDALPAIQRAKVIVVVAGMEGALASVVGGLVSVPVIAVPTSVGYGVSMGGLAPLLAMLSACAAGVTVVNIDNGFGAGFAASVINRA